MAHIAKNETIKSLHELCQVTPFPHMSIPILKTGFKEMFCMQQKVEPQPEHHNFGVLTI